MNKHLQLPFAAIFAIAAVLSTNPAFSQDRVVRPGIQQPGGEAEAQSAVMAEDVDGLIANLSADRPRVVLTRVFESGRVVERYPAAAISVERTGGVFTAHSQTLVMRGSMGATPVLEDLRFLDIEGTFYVLRDIYLDGQESDIAVGRATPGLLDAAQVREPQASASSAPSAAAPQISSIHGYTDVNGDGINDGIVAMGKCGGNYDGGRAVNNQAAVFNWTVSGANFGASKGTIKLGGVAFPAAAWSASSITFYPTLPYTYGPVTTALSVTTAAGNTVNYYVSLVPAIQTRIYGQCTWFVAYSRLNSGKQPSPNAYPPSPLGSSGWGLITAAYVPQVLDELVWQWSDASGQHKHTAIVTAVSGPTKSGTTSTWSVTIGEANAACTNKVTSKASSYQVQNSTITKPIQSQATTLAPGWFYRSAQ